MDSTTIAVGETYGKIIFKEKFRFLFFYFEIFKATNARIFFFKTITFVSLQKSRIDLFKICARIGAGYKVIK